MSLIVTGNFAQDLKPFVGKFLNTAEMDAPSTYDKVFEVVKGKGRYLQDVQTRGFGLAAVKPEGSAFETDDMSQLWIKVYEQVVYGIGFNVTWESMRDGNVLDVAKRGAQEARRSMLQTRENVLWNHFNRAFNSTYTGGDGVCLGSASHPTYAAGNQTNMPSTACDLSELALEQAAIDIKNFKNERGLKDFIRPKRLIIPVDLTYEATRILKSELRSGVQANDTNALRLTGTIPEVIDSVYLSDSDAWFVQTTASDGLKYIEDLGITLADDVEFSTMNAVYRAIMRFDSGWSNWRQVYCSAGA